MVTKRQLTWNTAGSLILLMALLGMVAGIGLIAWRIYLRPPFAAWTWYFYAVLPILPALVTFGLCLRARPVGRPTLVLASPILGGLMVCFYLALIGPAFYADIQCAPGQGSGLIVQLDCRCFRESSGGLTEESCIAEGWPSLPLIRLVGE
jgi:hypothetical protein